MAPARLGARACGLARLAGLAALAGPPPALAAACPSAELFADGTASLPVVLVYTGADGVSHLKTLQVRGVAAPFLNTGKTAVHTALGPAERVTLTQGPPDADIPIRAGGGRALFLILKGSSTVLLPDGSRATATPGTVLAFDDTASRTGHGGRTGPCGYVALSLAVPAGAPILAPQK